MAEIACSYCMQDLVSMADPRQLPCKHIFCMECMKSDCRDLTSYQCTVCRRVYELMTFDSLPTPSPECNVIKESKGVGDLVTLTAAMCCDRCRTEPAVGYCIDCGEKSCQRHMEYHDGYFDGLHETVDIMKYAQNSSQYNKAIRCVHHKKEIITMACNKCYHYNCLECGGSDESCDSVSAFQHCDVDSYHPPGGHTYSPLSKVETALRAQFHVLLSATSEKLTKIGELEKAAWQRMDTLVEDCKKMVKVVEKKTEEQVELIRTQSEALEEEIHKYQQEKTEQVVTFVTELMKKKEKIQEERKSVHRFLKNAHVTDLIKGKQENTQQLKAANNMELGKCDWTNQALHIGNKRRLEVKFGYGSNVSRSSLRKYPMGFVPGTEEFRWTN